MGHNELYGDVHGNVVQARDIYVQLGVDHHPLITALHAATVQLSGGFGVAVSPDEVLTLTAEGPSLVKHRHAEYACVLPGSRPGDRLVQAGSEPGAPVLNWRTGGVCGLVGFDGEIVAAPSLPGCAKASRDNHRWLDLLDADQLRAGDWRHLGPALRTYLQELRDVDLDHQYLALREAAPPLSKIYLNRQVTRQPDDEEAPPERLSAETMLAERPSVQVLGDPGVGKSSLVRRISAITARAWLDGEQRAFLPVPITADQLTRPGGLPDLLADGVVRWVHLTLDRTRLVELFRAEGLPGVPWLVLVDGLDEVFDSGARLNVLSAVTQHRKNPGYRFLLTSRPLARKSFLDRIDQRRYPSYVIEPFSDGDLHRFVCLWLERERHPAPEPEATRFLERVRASPPLYKLAHIPLISSMLCLLFAERPEGQLPRNQAELYGQYVSWARTKLTELGPQQKLHAMVDRHGPPAREAVDEVLRRIEELLQAIAFARQELGSKQSLVELAAQWHGVRRPEHVPEEDWAAVLGAALRTSGSVVERAGRTEFLHQTMEDFLTACYWAEQHPKPGKLIAPQREWPWPRLQTKLFFAARWAPAGRARHRALARLLRPWHWRQNIGFLAELHRHDIPLPPALRQRATRKLRAAVANPKTPPGDWTAYTGWLAELDPAAAKEKLAIVLRASQGREHLHYQAISALLRIAPEQALDRLHEFFHDSRYSTHAKLSLGRLVGEVAGPGKLVELAFGFGDQELRQAVGREVAAGGEPGWQALAELATNPAVSPGIQLEAVEALLGADAERALPLLLTLIRRTTDRKIRFAALRELVQRAPAQADEELQGILDAGDGEDRYEAALLLVDRLRRNENLLVSLADDPRLGARNRLAIAERVRNRLPADSIRILRAIAQDSEPHEAHLRQVFERLVQLSREDGVAGLITLVANRKQPVEERWAAVELVLAKASRREVVETLELVARSADFTGKQRLKAAKSGSADLLAWLAAESRLDIALREQAALTLAGRDQEAGARLFERLSADGSLTSDRRLALALRAEKLGGGPAALRRLAEESGLAMEIRRQAAAALPKRMARPLFAEWARSGTPENRLAAAEKLLSWDPRTACAVFTELAADRRAPSRIQERARALLAKHQR